MSQVKLTVLKSGPLLVADPESEVELIGADGNPVTPSNPKSFAICRCGASTSKPFCDGTHSKIGFEKAAEAVPESQE